MRHIRVAAVGYLNTLPLIAGLERFTGFGLVRAVPSDLVGMLERNEADLALVSLIDAARSATPLSIVPVGMIGCDGPTLTVRVFSRVPPAQIRVLHADTDSHTSVALARLILRRSYGSEARIEPFSPIDRGAARNAARWPDSVLLIGDKVVTEPPPGDDYPHRLDLGEAWRALTGQPFVYAIWMCRSADVADADLAHAAELLDRQRRHNAHRLGSLIVAGARRHGWPPATARHYLEDLLRYEPDVSALASASTFLGMCAQDGLIAPDRATLRIAPLAPSAAG